MTPERLARAISALREMSTYSAEDLLCCLAEDPSTFQYVGDLLASHDAITARAEIAGAKVALCYHDVGFVGTEHRHPMPGPCEGQEHAPVMCLFAARDDLEEVHGADCIEALRVYRGGGEPALSRWIETRRAERAALKESK